MVRSTASGDLGYRRRAFAGSAKEVWNLRIAFVVFSGMTTLDFVGVFDPVTRLKSDRYLPKIEWSICSYGERVIDQKGLALIPTAIHESLAGYDVVIVPGGPGTRRLMHDHGFLSWLKTMERTPIKVSVCTGALLLGAAGFLKGKKATTHHSALRLLSRFCRQVVSDVRVVDEGDVITAGGVTSSLDLGLYLCERLAGFHAREEIARQIEYEGTDAINLQRNVSNYSPKLYWTVETWKIKPGRESHFLRNSAALAKGKLTIFRDTTFRGLFWSPARWENAEAFEDWRASRDYKAAVYAIENDVLHHTTHRMEGVPEIVTSKETLKPGSAPRKPTFTVTRRPSKTGVSG